MSEEHRRPRRFGNRYEILEPLVSTGIDGLCAGRDHRLDRDVVLHLLPAGLRLDAAARRRLLREARILSGLGEPALTTIYDLASAAGAQALVMKPVSGRSLAGAIPMGGMQYPRALAVAKQLASALAAAHHAGIAHGSLSTGTILLDRGWQIHILDFALAGGSAEQDLAAALAIMGEIATGGRGAVSGPFSVLWKRPLETVRQLHSALLAMPEGPIADPESGPR